MVAETTTISIADVAAFKQKALAWADCFNVVCLLDSNNYNFTNYPAKEWVLAVDAIDFIDTGANHTLPFTGLNAVQPAGTAFEKLKAFTENISTPVFGFLGYDLKNEIESLHSNNPDGVGFPDMYFFKPRFILELTGNKLTVNRNYPETFELLEAIEKWEVRSTKYEVEKLNTQLKARTAKEAYLQNIEKIKQQIEAGDYYELNYCNEFYADNTTINAVQVFGELNTKAQAPFSCYFKLYDKYLMCASPERFIKKEGGKLISQPIKGTIKKGTTPAENDQLKQQLQANEKERAENLMIVDLVRNDLARSSQPGTVQVEELCGIYEFATVNQMISTVTAQINNTHAIDAIKHAFPMGSMTGAPKIEVMKNIEQYESFKRGLYSGSVGYITPNGDYDFNVVIRSILYNHTQQYLSIRVGGAITYDSVAENEWNEILLKAQGMLHVLNATLVTG
ncbi:MAG TPA: anthranilate synthase component I family protein [Chitinophagales bacterium]|nr:anthranilate synthase component I family protein [Chitinophagales bacterium]